MPTLASSLACSPFLPAPASPREAGLPPLGPRWPTQNRATRQLERYDF